MENKQPLAYAQANSSRFVSELKDFIRFPSISAQPKHAGDLRKCAAWLAAHLRRIGLKRVEVIPTKGHPLVYAEWLHAPNLPTVLIYGHYDVQPASLSESWRSPPFVPTQHGEDLYGRGASDDKGQLFAHLKSLESWLKTTGKLPVNVKCLFEGEEEIGSRNLSRFLTQNSRELSADVAVVSDMSILAPDRPALTYALRGALAFELEVTGPQTDLHAGTFGGAVHNPLQGLCEIISSLHDARTGRIAIPGFYDKVRHWSKGEHAGMARTGPTDQQILREARSRIGWGEQGYTLYERTTLRPALTINGLSGGYQGIGPKAVIPAKATAKLAVRLVPDQTPQEIAALLQKHFARITPPTLRATMRIDLGVNSVVVSRSNTFVEAAAVAYQKGFGAAPVFKRSGGTIPAVSSFQDILGLPIVMMGFGLPDDRMHAPDEKFHLPNFHKGIATSIWFLSEVAARRSWNPMQIPNYLNRSSAMSAG